MFGVRGKRRESFILMSIIFLLMQLTLSFIQQLFTGDLFMPGIMLGTHHMMGNKTATIPLLLSLHLVEE